MRFFVHFAYNGTAYHGWQFQPNANSVQQEMEAAFSKLLRERVTLVAAGRTDTGVHARHMTAHFDAQVPFEQTDEAKAWGANIAFRLNGMLPPDITIYSIVPVRDNAHARFDATSRTYEYWVTTQKNPFTQHLVTFTHFQLDYARMNEAAALLLEEKDFASFCKLHSDNKTTLCDVRRAFWEERPLPLMSSYNTSTPPQQGELEGVCHVFTIEADRFLRNMVRAVVGTLFEVGRGRITPDEMRDIVRAGSRQAAGQSMPPDGLYLTKIDYPSDIYR